jgi:hypothetical protein
MSVSPASRSGRLGVLAVSAFIAAGLVAAHRTNAAAARRPPEKNQAPARSDERFDLKVRNDFFAGLAGDREALARGMKTCEEILKKNPKHGEALVWHGSGLFMEAGEAFMKGDQQKGIQVFQRAVQELNDAAKYEPDNIGVLVPRAAVFLVAAQRVPDAQQSKAFAATALGDYEKVYAMQKKELAKLGVHPRGELLFGLAEGARRTGMEEKAREYLQMIVQTCKESAWEKEAKDWLATPTLMSHSCIGCHVAAP